MQVQHWLENKNKSPVHTILCTLILVLYDKKYLIIQLNKIIYDGDVFV